MLPQSASNPSYGIEQHLASIAQAIANRFPTANAVNGQFDYIGSGCVWSGDSYGGSLNGSMTAGIIWIGGRSFILPAVTAHAFTANKDCYIDVSIVNDTATLTYTDNTTNTASLALPSGSLRLAIIVAGATITAVGAVNQGEESKVLPIISTVTLAVTDSLGNLICPRDPNYRILGYKQVLSSQGGITTITNLTGLSVTVIVPAGRKIKITGQSRLNSTVNLDNMTLFIRESTTALNQADVNANSSTGVTDSVEVTLTPSAGLHTYVLSLQRTLGTGTLTSNASATNPASIKVELA